LSLDTPTDRSFVSQITNSSPERRDLCFFGKQYPPLRFVLRI
jgi:hypothetical protein